MRLHSKKLAIINLSIIILFSVIGIGYANWINGTGINTTISTGSIDTVFSNCEVKQDVVCDAKQVLPDKKQDDISEGIKPDDKKPGDMKPEIKKPEAKVSSVKIDESGKRMAISIDNAYPGFSTTIKYTIVNNGDIPVYCKLTNKEQKVALINIEDNDAVLEPHGGSSEGTVSITIQEVEKKTTYDLALNLDYIQYNELQFQ